MDPLLWMCVLSIKEEPNWQNPQTNLNTSPKSEPTLELINSAAPSVEAHHLMREEIPDKSWLKKASKKSEHELTSS